MDCGRSVWGIMNQCCFTLSPLDEALYIEMDI